MSELIAYKGGKVNISEDVIGVIASIAASEVDGVSSLSGSLSQEMFEMIGRKNFKKGIDVEVTDGEVSVELHIIAKFGSIITKVANDVQQTVKLAIESMTGLKVKSVNISIVGISKSEKQTQK